MSLPRRWPMEPVERLLHTSSPTEIGHRLGIDRRQVHRWRELGGLITTHADRAAVALGLHPAIIWPDWCPTETEVAS